MNNKKLINAYKAAISVHALSAKLYLDVINSDPSGAGYQYPPLICDKALSFYDEVANSIADMLNMNGESQDMFSSDDVYNGHPYCPEDLATTSSNFDSIVKKAYADIIKSAKRCVRLLGWENAPKSIKTAYNNLIDELDACVQCYFIDFKFTADKHRIN